MSLHIIFFAALGLTVLSLLFGISTFFKGSPLARYANVAMRWRVLLQGITLMIFLLLLWTK